MSQFGDTVFFLWIKIESVSSNVHIVPWEIHIAMVPIFQLQKAHRQKSIFFMGSKLKDTWNSC